MTGILCDRCGKSIYDAIHDWDEGAGNCTLCGDDLCVDCAQGFDEDGMCLQCHRDSQHGKHQKGTKYVKPYVPTTGWVSTIIHDVEQIENNDKTIESNGKMLHVKEFVLSGTGFQFALTAIMKD